MPEQDQGLGLKVLIPYFGVWPSWFPFFLRSCAENPGIEWLLFSDCGIPGSCPPNVSIVEISFDDYCGLVSERLGIDFAPSSSRKLCDIKPALAEVHAEHLEGARFWAFGDIDVVLGDLEGYLRRRQFDTRDVTALHSRRLSGHLTVLRNTPEINSAFRRVPDWKALLVASHHVAFDEKAFSRVFLRHKNSPRWVQWLARKWNPWLRRADFREAFTTPDAKIPWVDGSFDFPAVWYWKQGRLWNDRDATTPYPYLHFMHWKKQWTAEDVKGVEQAWDPSLVLEIRPQGMTAAAVPDV